MERIHRRTTQNKSLNDPDNHGGVITHLEPDILECEVKQTWRSTTINIPTGGERILAELFQILKDDAVKVLHSICQQIWKSQQWSQDWKSQFSFPVTKKGNAKNVQTNPTVTFTSHASKIMLKGLKTGFNNMWTENFQVYKLSLEKEEEPEVNFPTFMGS